MVKRLFLLSLLVMGCAEAKPKPTKASAVKCVARKDHRRTWYCNPVKDSCHPSLKECEASL